VKAIILLGAPGAGKGTVAERIRECSSFIHVSTGDMLRKAVKEDTEIGRKAEGFMNRGELVPYDIMERIIEDHVRHCGDETCHMFDGFPRTEAQAVLLEKTLAKHGGGVDRVYYLDASRDVFLARLTGRRVCRVCAANYHVINLPPKKDGICDTCGGELYQRPDDMKDTIASRFDVFDRKTEKLISYYTDKGLLIRINCDVDVDVLVGEIMNDLEMQAS